MIGYYVHHQGRGHVHRAISIAAAIDTVVVGLSSLARPPEWTGPWVVLPRDDEGPEPIDVSARGRLHWVPEMDAGLTARMAEISSWIADVEPELMVVDVSAEVSLLARLHGTPVVTMVLPGDRRDSAHDLVHSVARRIVAAWPADVSGMVTGLDTHQERVSFVGGMSRFDGREIASVSAHEGKRRVLVLAGAGDEKQDRWDLSKAQAESPGWSWQFLGPDHVWLEDPWAEMCRAEVVVTHAGQNAIAEVAAARRPAIVIPRARPFGEQDAMVSALLADGRFPVMSCSSDLSASWAELLEATARLDGTRWGAWNDGTGARRAAEVILDELTTDPARTP